MKVKFKGGLKGWVSWDFKFLGDKIFHSSKRIWLICYNNVYMIQRREMENALSHLDIFLA